MAMSRKDTARQMNSKPVTILEDESEHKHFVILFAHFLAALKQIF